MKQPVIVACGVGRDSTAMLVHMYKTGWRPDAILFANVGSEKAGTYEFVPHLRAWLDSVGFPPLTVVRYQPKTAPYRSLEGNMILNATLPGATFNKHTCTLKFKVQPQNSWTARWPVAQEAWASGKRVVKLIGFEADEEYRLTRADCKAHAGQFDDDKHLYEYQYPLMDWNLNLDRCIEEIQSVGLPVPPKSACYFCPNQKTWEVDELDPEDRARIILMELVAEPYNQKVHGLWRRPRKSDGRPGSITEYILARELPFVPLSDLCSRVALNSNCQKARNDGEHTFDPPHNALRLRDLLVARGHQVPTIEVSDTLAPNREEGVYLEDVREVPGHVEDAVHDDLLDLF